MEFFLGALIVALVLTAIFAGGYEGERDPARLLLYAAMIFVPLWAFAVWIPPAGPLVFGIAWFQLLMVGLLIALLVAAATPPEYYRARLEKGSAAEQRWARGASAFLWVLVAALALLIFVGYMTEPSPLSYAH